MKRAVAVVCLLTSLVGSACHINRAIVQTGPGAPPGAAACARACHEGPDDEAFDCMRKCPGASVIIESEHGRCPRELEPGAYCAWEYPPNRIWEGVGTVALEALVLAGIVALAFIAP